MLFARIAFVALGLSVVLTAYPQAANQALRPESLVHPRGNFSNNVARPLRYWPAPAGGGEAGFIITNGPEYFNRPLYSLNSGFRIDGGDKPEFSLYLPGRGGNLRLGIKSPAGSKWLNAAQQIVAIYQGGSLSYELSDPLLDGRKLFLTVLPLSETKGVVVEVFLSREPDDHSKLPAKIVFGYGGASGERGARGGDIGCERQPVSELFQLRPEACRENAFSLANDTFVLRHHEAAIAGVTPVGTRLSVADATQWASLESLCSSVGKAATYPVVVGEFELQPDGRSYLALQLLPGGTNHDLFVYKATDLPAAFCSAAFHRVEIANRVCVSTPDLFINAAVPALCVAADAVWDAQQQCYMHGAVAWRTRLLGWRGQYAGDALGWHERTAAHFASFAKHQNTNPIPNQIPPPDESFSLARSEAAIHSQGDLSKNHYDMNLLAVDAFFRHLLWTGDTRCAREMWPVIERHLAWERRLFRREFGPDKLPLYEAYAAIWASDNLSYNGGGTAHASACNYFANAMAARAASLLGQDPAPYQKEAGLILRAMNQYLWLPNEGNFAESKDLLGLQLVHPNSGLWTFYHTLDSGVPSPRQAWQMTRWLDGHLAHIPITGPGVPDEQFFTLPETSWMPYQWSLNNVVMAEAAHASLGYWQANRPDVAFALFKGELLDSMFLGLCPGNLGCLTSHDMARGEAQRDFADAIGINARALVEGLFGIHPDALAGTLKIVPGFPASWTSTAIVHPDLTFRFDCGLGAQWKEDRYQILQKFTKPMRLTLQIVARGTQAEVTVDEKPAAWNWVTNLFGAPRIEINRPAAKELKIVVYWKGQPPAAHSPEEPPQIAPEKVEPFDWNVKISEGSKFDAVNLGPCFNAQVTQIFRQEYRAPRSPFASLATPKQGLGGWCEPNAGFDVDDSGLRAAAARNSGKLVLPDGISFATPAQNGAKNIIFTSQWDNYPREVSVPLEGKSSHAFLLLAGSTGPLQSQFENGEIVVAYADGSVTRLPLRNPTNWWPIDQDYFTDDFAFRRDAPIPPRVDLATGNVRVLNAAQFKGQGGKIPGGAATVLDLALDKTKPLKSLTVRALANEVIIGLMGVTLQR